MSKELMKELAKRSLENKWYRLDEISAEWKDWTNSCAFCHDADDLSCGGCLIKGLPICNSVEILMDANDKSLIVDALEELAKDGKMSQKMWDRFRTEVEGLY